MSVDVVIQKTNESYIKCICGPSIAMELRDHFSFEIPNAVHVIRAMKKRGMQGFDGKIRLYNMMTGSILFGLLPNVIEFCSKNNYQYHIDDQLTDTEFSKVEAEHFIKTLGLPEKYTPKDYQQKGLIEGVRGNRRLFVCPTGGGKTLTAYMLHRYFNKRSLIIVPTIHLVMQMDKQFKQYGCDQEIHQISGGKEKQSDAPITISTWQSLYKMPTEFFNQFDVVFGDEAHGIEAKKSQAMFGRMINIKHRFGFTATIKDTTTNPLVLQGIFGKIVELENTKSLIEKKVLSGLKIKVLMLKYPKDECRLVSKMTYPEEVKYIDTHKRRINYIKNLTNSLPKSVLLLFRHIEHQGNLLKKAFEGGKRNVFYIHGLVPGEERERIRQIVEQEQDPIILGSMGAVSTGVDIYNIHNIILCSSLKDSVGLKQGIGRGLRRNNNKTNMTVFDIVDNFTYCGKLNYVANHCTNRIKLYNNEGFDYRIYNINFAGQETVYDKSKKTS